MKRSDWIAIGGMIVGVLVTTIGSTLYLSFKIGIVYEKVMSMEKTLDRIPKIESDLSEVKVKVDILWRRHLDEAYSRRMPDQAAIATSRDSEIIRFADQHYDDILSKVIALEPENASQTEEALISVVGLYRENDSCVFKLRKSVLPKGYDIDSLLLVAALSIKDRVISDLGFKR